MNKQTEALKLALEALSPWAGEDANHTEQYAAYHAIREALAHAPSEREQPAQKGCMRCNTPKKCALYGCSPLTWPAEQPAIPTVITCPFCSGKHIPGWLHDLNMDRGAYGEQPTCKQSLQVWVIPNGKGGGQFSWEPEDERFWTRMQPAIKQDLTPEQNQCKFPLCHNEDYQQALAEQIKRELYTGETAQQEPVAWCPDVCPITGLPFFMWIEHHETGQMVPTYGGPYDSYTIPVRDKDGSYCRERYDHDRGGWLTDEVEDVGVQIVSDQAYVSDEPPASKPLTDEQIEKVWRRVQANDFHDCVQPFARAIEAAHGIKGDA